MACRLCWPTTKEPVLHEPHSFLQHLQHHLHSCHPADLQIIGIINKVTVFNYYLRRNRTWNLIYQLKDRTILFFLINWKQKCSTWDLKTSTFKLFHTMLTKCYAFVINGRDNKLMAG